VGWGITELNGKGFSHNHGLGLKLKAEFNQSAKCAGASQEAAVQATKAAMKAKRVLEFTNTIHTSEALLLHHQSS
jgi:hypothetical protein